MTDLESLRREHDEEVVGRELASLIARIVDATAPTYPPDEFCPDGVWSRSALDDAAQDWALTRLLERGHLTVMLESARSVGALRAMLTRSFKQHLTSSRRRTSATNLFSRLSAMLRKDDVFVVSGRPASPSTQRWTLQDRPKDAQASPGTVDQLIKAVCARSDDDLGVLHYGPYSLKSSPILRNPQLRNFLVFLLEEADGALTVTEIFEVMRHRFNLVTLPPAELADDLVDRRPPVSVSVESRLTARAVVAQLGGETTRLLRAIAEADDPRDAVERSGSTVAALTAAQESLHALIAEYADTPDEAVAIYRHVHESLYGEDETYD